MSRDVRLGSHRIDSKVAGAMTKGHSSCNRVYAIKSDERGAYLLADGIDEGLRVVKRCGIDECGIWVG